MRIIVFLIWIIDIFNIGSNVFGFNLAKFLDVTLPINTWIWIIIWLLMPGGGNDQMKLYAVFRDGKLYRASYKQNVPFYETALGAQKALQSATNCRSLPIDMYKKSEYEKQQYLTEQKKRFDVREFDLSNGKIIS